MDFEYLNYQEALGTMNTTVLTEPVKEVECSDVITTIVEEPTVENNTPSEGVEELAVESNLEEVEVTTSKKNKK